MSQLDLFAHRPVARATRVLPPEERRGEEKGVGLREAADVLARIQAISQRPRHAYMLLEFIDKIADGKGEAGPRVKVGNRFIPIRDWLADSLFPLGSRDVRRVELVRRTREDLASAGMLPVDEAEAAAVVEEAVRDRLRPSARSAISRSVSDLVRAGCLKRYYAGNRVDHENRGARREAVYVVPAAVRSALHGRSVQATGYRPAMPDLTEGRRFMRVGG